MKLRGKTLALCAALGITSCVQVLGIEEAKKQESGGSGGTAGASASSSNLGRSRISCKDMPGPSCPCETEPQAACTQCLKDNCAAAVQSCAADPGCRVELDVYAACLGRSCGDETDQEACTRFPSSPPLQSCIIQCQAECARTQLLSPCELYCGCMADFCADELDQAHITDCVADCEALDADVRDCRRLHCEFGLGDHTHCQHAADIIHVCASEEELSVDDRDICLDAKESTWPCDDQDQCCSGVCLTGGTCQ